MVAMFVAIGVFRESGAMDMLVKLLSPITNLLGIPREVLPLALMRPSFRHGFNGNFGRYT